MASGRHILLVELGIGRGGATHCLLSLVEMCLAQGWRTTVALAYPVPELERAESACSVLPLYTDRAYRRGMRIRRVAAGVGRPRGRTASIAAFFTALAAADLPVAGRLAVYARRHAVDLIHANNELLANRVAVLAGRLAGVPVISHQRGWSCRSWATRWLLRQTDRIIAVSDAVATDLIEAGACASRVDRIYDGIQARRFGQVDGRREAARAALGYGPQHRVVGLPAVLLPWKGHEMFLRAFAEVARVRPDARALLVGASPANIGDLRPGLERQAAESGLRDRVRFMGHCDNMADMYAAMDLVAHASLEPEPFGLVVLEGMAAGRAIVAADAGGPAEIVHHGVDGWLYRRGDSRALAAALLHLLDDHALRRRIADQAPERARWFDPRRTRCDTLAVYDRVLSERAGMVRRADPLDCAGGFAIPPRRA